MLSRRGSLFPAEQGRPPGTNRQTHEIAFSSNKFPHDGCALFSPVSEVNLVVLLCVSTNSVMLLCQCRLDGRCQACQWGIQFYSLHTHTGCDILPSQAQSTFDSICCRIEQDARSDGGGQWAMRGPSQYRRLRLSLGKCVLVSRQTRHGGE